MNPLRTFSEPKINSRAVNVENSWVMNYKRVLLLLLAKRNSFLFKFKSKSVRMGKNEENLRRPQTAKHIKHEASSVDRHSSHWRQPIFFFNSLWFSPCLAQVHQRWLTCCYVCISFVWLFFHIRVIDSKHHTASTKNLLMSIILLLLMQTYLSKHTEKKTRRRTKHDTANESRLSCTIRRHLERESEKKWTC